MTLLERMAQLEKIQKQIPGALEEATKNATLRAIEKAEEMTPPVGGDDDLSGTHTRTGAMKSRWRSDSQISPTREGLKFTTVLENRAGETEDSENDTSYASYVDQGFHMDRHFVPGLYINPDTKKLEYDPVAAEARTVGIMVGTKTKKVPGIFMVDAAKKEYKRVLRLELKRLEGMLK